jgi:hypothetical protein
MKYVLMISAVAAIGFASPAFSDEVGVGVGVGPAGAGVTVGTSHDHDRTIIREHRHEPRDKTVIIKKEREHYHPDRKVIIHEDD